VVQLDAVTVLLQWGTGTMFGCWVTTRHREVGVGYGWLLRGTALSLAAGAMVVAALTSTRGAVAVSAVAVTVACAVALGSSVRRRAAGVSGYDSMHEERSARVAAMTGIERSAAPSTTLGAAEFDPRLDLTAASVGVAALLVDAGVGDGPIGLAAARFVVGAGFLGLVTAAMLLGHWYLVQPGLPRRLLLELVRALAVAWPVEIAVLLWPTGMVSVLNGSIDDGWGGILGWTWVMCAVSTIVLVFVTRAALKERQYSAIMAATGLLYLAILTAFGTDLVARAVLSA
jgi:hypothetical protein